MLPKDQTQTGVAGRDAALAMREYAGAHSGDDEMHKTLNWLASIYDDLHVLPLQGDYDMLIARKVRAMAEHFRQPTLKWEVLDTARELMAEIHEAGI